MFSENTNNTVIVAQISFDFQLTPTRDRSKVASVSLKVFCTLIIAGTINGTINHHRLIRLSLAWAELHLPGLTKV